MSDRYLRKVEFSSEDLGSFMTADRKTIEENAGQINEITYDKDGNPRAKLVKRGYNVSSDNFTVTAIGEVREILKEDGLAFDGIVPIKGRKLEVYGSDGLLGTVSVSIGTDPKHWEDRLPNGDKVWDMEKYDWEDFDRLSQAIGEQEDSLMDFVEAVNSLPNTEDMDFNATDGTDRDDFSDAVDSVPDLRYRPVDENDPDVIESRRADKETMAEMRDDGAADEGMLKDVEAWMGAHPNYKPIRPPEYAEPTYHYEQIVIYGDPEAVKIPLEVPREFTKDPARYRSVYGECRFMEQVDHGNWGIIRYDTHKPLGIDEETTKLKTELMKQMDTSGMTCVGGIRLTSQDMALVKTLDRGQDISNDGPDGGPGSPPSMTEPDGGIIILTEDDLPKLDGPGISGPDIFY